MDKPNRKKQKVNDIYWKYSWFLAEGLEYAIEQGSDEEILKALKNPGLYKAKS